MDKIEKSINNLKSPNKNTRFNACEELRVAYRIPEFAIIALEAATNDPDPLVADAAYRALEIHKSPPLRTESSTYINEENPRTVKSLAVISLICGLLGLILTSLIAGIGVNDSLASLICILFASNLILGLIAIILGIIAMRIAMRIPDPYDESPAEKLIIAVPGIFFGILTLLAQIPLWWIVLWSSCSSC